MELQSLRLRFLILRSNVLRVSLYSKHLHKKFSILFETYLSTRLWTKRLWTPNRFTRSTIEFQRTIWNSHLGFQLVQEMCVLFNISANKETHILYYGDLSKIPMYQR